MEHDAKKDSSNTARFTQMMLSHYPPCREGHSNWSATKYALGKNKIWNLLVHCSQQDTRTRVDEKHMGRADWSKAAQLCERRQWWGQGNGKPQGVRLCGKKPVDKD